MVGSPCLIALFGDLFAPCDDPPSATCSCRRGIETKFDVVSDASIQRAINLGQRATQLARQRSKASRQVLWSPALPAAVSNRSKAALIQSPCRRAVILAGHQT